MKTSGECFPLKEPQPRGDEPTDVNGVTTQRSRWRRTQRLQGAPTGLWPLRAGSGGSGRDAAGNRPVEDEEGCVGPWGQKRCRTRDPAAGQSPTLTPTRGTEGLGDFLLSPHTAALADAGENERVSAH